MNLVEIQEALKGVPDAYLAQHVKQPDGSVPQFMALAELSRRQDMRARFAGSPPTSTVADDVLAREPSQTGSAQPVPGQPPTGIAAGPAQPQGAPRGFASGGYVGSGIFSGFGPDDYMPPMQDVDSGAYDPYLQKVGAFEPGNAPNPYTAQSKNSSAYGKYQFIRDTWRKYAKVAGVHPDDRSPEAQERVMAAYTADSRQRLGDSGFEPTPTNLYSLHLLGQNGGSNFLNNLKADPSRSPSDVFSDKVRKANPAIFKGAKTLQDVHNNMAKAMGEPPTGQEVVEGLQGLTGLHQRAEQFREAQRTKPFSETGSRLQRGIGAAGNIMAAIPAMAKEGASYAAESLLGIPIGGAGILAGVGRYLSEDPTRPYKASQTPGAAPPAPPAPGGGPFQKYQPLVAPDQLAEPPATSPELASGPDIETLIPPGTSSPQGAAASPFDAIAEKLAAYYSSTIPNKEDQKNMALLQAGLGILGGDSPFFGVNVGRGAMQGTQYYQQEGKDARETQGQALRNMLELEQIRSQDRRSEASQKMQQEQLNIARDRANAYIGSLAARATATGTMSKYQANIKQHQAEAIWDMIIKGRDPASGTILDKKTKDHLYDEYRSIIKELSPSGIEPEQQQFSYDHDVSDATQ